MTMPPRLFALLTLVALTLTACVPGRNDHLNPSASLPTPGAASPGSAVTPAEGNQVSDPHTTKVLQSGLELTRASQDYVLTFSALLTGTSALDQTNADPRVATNILSMISLFNGSSWQTTFTITDPAGGDAMLSNELVTLGDVSYARHTPPVPGAVDTRYTLPRQAPLAIQTAPGAFDLLLGAPANLAEFQPAGEQRVDNQQCMLYRSTGDVSSNIADLFAYMPSLVTPDRSGAQVMQHELVIWQCADGYFHKIQANLAAKSGGRTAREFAISATLQLSSFGQATVIGAPAAEPLPNPPAFADNPAQVTATKSVLLFDVPIAGQPIDQINIGENMQLLAQSSDTLWYQVGDMRGLAGWVDARRLNIQPTQLAALPIVKPEDASLPMTWSPYQHGRLHLALPKTWQTLPLSKADLERTVGQMAAQNPQFAALVRNLIQSGQYKQVGLLAVELGATTRFKGNLTLIAQPSPAGMPPEQVLERLGAQLLHVPELHVLASDTTLRIGGLTAARFTYTLSIKMPDGSIGTMLGIQYYLADAIDTYVITLTGDPGGNLTSTASRMSAFISVDAAPDASTPSNQLTQRVANGGNLRSAPRIAADTVIGQICPDDQVTVLSSQSLGAAIWKRIRVISTAKACHPERVPIGTEGWLNSSLLAP
jgi:hypothetical protein